MERRITGLDIYVGPMFSGKSSTLLGVLNKMTDLNFKSLYINNKKDSRDDIFSTHSSLLKGYCMKIDALKVVKFDKSIIEIAKKYDVIGIDEAQFFGTDILEFVREMVDEHLKYVIVVGLDGTYTREKFGFILDLIPMCNKIVKLNAYCKTCSEKGYIVDAIYTNYLGSGNSQIIIGGAEKYEALCRTCFLHKNK